MILTGHIRDAHDPRDLPFDAAPLLLSGAVVTSDEIDLRPFCAPVADQICNDCVGHTTSDAAFATAAADGSPIERPAPLFGYAVARLLEAPLQDGGPRLRDRGCSPRLMFKGFERWGMVAEARWPELAENVDVIPPDDAFREGENATIKEYRRIPDGLGTTSLLVAALRRLRFPTVCFVVDDAFAQIGSGVYREPGGNVIGSHCMLAVGHSPTLRATRLKNHWGPRFGEDGYVWVADELLERVSYDRWVIEVAPEAVR